MSAKSKTKNAAKDAKSFLKRPGFWVAGSVVAIAAVMVASTKFAQTWISKGVNASKKLLQKVQQ